MPTPSIDQLRALNQATFQHAFASFVNEHKPPALAAGLVLDGVLSSVFSHGMEGKPHSPPEHVAFRIASMTKCFAAAALLKLRDQGAVQFEVPISHYLTSLSGTPWEKITVFHLLTMQSGLPTDDPWGDRLLGWSNHQFADLLRSPLTFVAEPGSEYHYSNLGYMILGSLIATLSAQPAISYISKELLEPLGMNETCWNPAHVHWLAGHTRHGDKLTEEPVTITEYDGAVFAGLWSTVSDLCIWMRFLMDLPRGGERGLFEHVLSSASRQYLQQPLVKVPRSSNAPEEIEYGLGLRTSRCEQFQVVGHSGGLPGYGSHFRWCREQECGVIALSNVTYAPVTGPCRFVLEKVIYDSLARQLVVPEIVTKRALAALNLIRSGWDEKFATDLFSSNFFLDNPIPLFREVLSSAAERIEEDDSEPVIVADRGLRARVILSGEELFSLMLAPAEEARIQQLIFPWTLPPSRF